MGTKAVFAVANDVPGSYYATILGATHDGTRGNLKYLGHLFAEVTRGLQSVTQVSKRKWHCGIDQVIDAIDKHGRTIWFKDNYKNAEWVSWSAIYDPKEGKLWIFQGMFEDSLGYEMVNLRTAKTQGDAGLEIAKAYRAAQREAMMPPEKKAARDRKEAEKKERAKQRALKKLSAKDRAALGL